MLIIRAGITLVTLSDKRKYALESINANPTDLIISIVMMMRGHEESAMKAFRVAGAYEEKRRIAASGEPQDQPFTRMLPGWLRWNEQTKRHEVVEERATILRDIFAKADAGWSKHRIARYLNEARVEPWGKGKRKGTHWHSSYIQKLLTNEAVVGTFTPHKAIKNAAGRKREPQQPIEAYFPAVIDREVFARVSTQAKARAARGRHADTAPKSVFAGLLRCARCDGSVVRVNKGDYAYLVFSKAHARAGCEYVAMRYHDAEKRVIETVKGLVAEAPRGRDTADIEAEIKQTRFGL